MPDLLEHLRASLADRYSLLAEIGRGGMGAVFVAEDLRHHRQVAIKALHPELAAIVGTERFTREIEIAARLDHPHILPVYDSGVADGLFFYVMPHVEGESLRERLAREKQLPVDEAVRITREVADGLHYAHEHGVVHRDVKPANIMLAGGHARIADFGVARAIENAGEAKLTATGIAVGSPAYMSPEQAAGEPADRRSDVYSLACLLYEMLVGDPPFSGPTPESVRARRAAGVVPSVTAVRESVGAATEEVVRKALSRAAADRHRTAKEFADELAASVAERHEPETPPARRSGRRARREWIAAIATGLAAILAIWHFGFGGLPGLVRPAAASFFKERDRVLVAAFDNETDEPALAMALREAVATDLDQSDYVRIVGREKQRAALQAMRLPDTTRLDVATAIEMARRQAYPAVVSGSISPVGSGYQLTAQIVESSSGEAVVRLRETALDESHILDAVERLSRSLRRQLGESLLSIRRSKPLPDVTTTSLEALKLYAQGVDYVRIGDYDASVPLFERAVSIDSAFAAAYRALTVVYGNTFRVEGALASSERAYRFSERLPDRERYSSVAMYHSQRGYRDSAAYYYALLFGLEPDDHVAANNLGDAYEDQGRYEEALDLYRRSIALDPGGWTPYYNAASAARSLGRLELADSMLAQMSERFPGIPFVDAVAAINAYYAANFARADSVARDMVERYPPFFQARAFTYLASMAASRGHLARSIGLADSARAAFRAAGAESSTPIVTTLAAWVAGEPGLALPALRTARAEPPAGTPFWQHMKLGTIANGYALAGDLVEARRLLARMDSIAGSGDVHVWGIGEYVRAVIARQEGDPESSLEHLRRGVAQEYGVVRVYGRILAGDAYTDLELLEKAAAQYDSALSSVGLNWRDAVTWAPLIPRAHERLGHVSLALGDTATAVRHLAAFADMWATADPELQPRVKAARELAGRLSRAAGFARTN